MFESLSEKLNQVFQRLGRKGKLTEQDVEEALKEVRVALLEADVHFKVVKSFIARVRERAVGAEVMESLTPAQQVVKIVHEELVQTLGGSQSKLDQAPQPPTVVMLVGLQGSGKTTTAAKLAYLLRKQGARPLLVAADPYRPAAIAQLQTLGKQLNLPVHAEEGKMPPQVCEGAVRSARQQGYTHVILDTAGRLHVDERLMQELAEIKARVGPTEVLLVADAMTGQDAVRVAEQFHQQVGITGLILTKLDGDARGGAALSIRSVTGVPIKYVGVGEKTDALEPFYPDRLAGRILGMGDVLTLIEKAQAHIDQGRAKEIEKKLRQATFDLEDFLEQMRQVQQMGPLDQLLGMIPGLSNLLGGQRPQVDEREIKRVEAIILSMTPEERRNPDIIGGSRRRRIARGSGTTPADVNRLLNQFQSMRKMMKMVASGRPPRNLIDLFR